MPYQLFSLRLPADCSGLPVRMLINDEPIQVALSAFFNPNNTTSVSIDGQAPADFYAGNEPNSDSLNCPLADITLEKELIER